MNYHGKVPDFSMFDNMTKAQYEEYVKNLGSDQ